MIVQPLASRRTLVERCRPSEEALLVAVLRPSLEELTETELLDEPCPEDREEAAAPSAPAFTLVSITRPSAV